MNISDKAESKKRSIQNLIPYRAGETGNPAGRPKGARNKLGEVFLDALYEDFKANGTAAIQDARKESPLGYVRVCASLLPAEINITKTNVFDEFTASELTQLADAIERGLAKFSERTAEDGSEPEAGALPPVH